MAEEPKNENIDRSRLTLLAGLSAAAASGACTPATPVGRVGPNPAIRTTRFSHGRNGYSYYSHISEDGIEYYKTKRGGDGRLEWVSRQEFLNTKQKVADEQWAQRTSSKGSGDRGGDGGGGH